MLVDISVALSAIRETSHVFVVGSNFYLPSEHLRVLVAVVFFLTRLMVAIGPAPLFDPVRPLFQHYFECHGDTSLL